jgi:hypothetical protein
MSYVLPNLTTKIEAYEYFRDTKNGLENFPVEEPNEKLHGFRWAGRRSHYIKAEIRNFKYLENQEKITI